jgi:hypothetical protein
MDTLAGMPQKPFLLHVAACTIVLPVPLRQGADEDVCIEEMVRRHNRLQEK